MANEQFSSARKWIQKFRYAFRGLERGVRGQASFAVHVVAAAVAIGLGGALGITALEWCALVLSIAAVLVAELFNSALEWMAKAMTNQYDERIRDALDVASAAVLVAASASVVVGAIIFLPRLAKMLGW